jgi:hypothetical protein
MLIQCEKDLEALVGKMQKVLGVASPLLCGSLHDPQLANKLEKQLSTLKSELEVCNSCVGLVLTINSL